MLDTNKFPKYVIIEANPIYEAFNINLDFNIPYFDKIEIVRQCISKLDYGQKSVLDSISKVISFNLLITEYSEHQQNILQAIASEIVSSLYFKCCELGLFSIDEQSGNQFFPYFPESLTVSGIAFLSSSPYS